MALQKSRIDQIVAQMLNMKDGDVQFLGNFEIHERQFIVNAIRNQRGSMFELDGTADDPKSHTKFRKMTDFTKNVLGDIDFNKQYDLGKYPKPGSVPQMGKVNRKGK